MGGMSEFTVMLDDYGIGWRLGYPLFALAMTILGLALWRIIRTWIDHRMGNGGRATA